MESHNKIISIFGEEVNHLHGNLFRIKKDKIKISPKGLSVENGNLIYGNPRWFVNSKGEQQAKGIEKEKMNELKNSIQNDGLENPLRLRVSKNNKTTEIINGERRFRCIQDLVEKDLPCFDSKSGCKKPASEVFEWIDCRIEFMDDKTALRVALRPNETSEIIGDLANLNLVKILKQSNFDDQEIIKTTGKSISWLRETEKIISLDQECLDNFKKEKINRTVALRLALIENVEERISLLDKIKNIAETKHNEKIQKTNEKIQKIEQNQQIAEITANIANKKGDEEKEKKHREIANLQKEKAQKAKKNLEDLENKKTIATSKDIEQIEDVNKPLSHKKIKLIYIDLINEIIENEGLDEDGEQLGLDLNILNSICCVLSEILEGNKNALEVLAEHCAVEQVDASEEDYDNSEEYEDEDENEEYEDDLEYEEYDEGEEDEEWEETPAELEAEFRDMVMMDETNYEEDFD